MAKTITSKGTAGSTAKRINLKPCGSTATMVLHGLQPDWSARTRKNVRIRIRWPDLTPEDRFFSYVVCHRKDFVDSLPELTKNLRSEWRLLLLTEDEPVESIIPQLMRLGIRDETRIHVAKLRENVEKFLGRFAEALGSQDTDKAIFDATWVGDTLVVVSPDFERLDVPLSDLPEKLREAPVAQRKNFEIDEYCEFIYWPDLDIHIGWSQFEQAVNPRARFLAQQESHDFNRRYGKAIRTLRDRQEPTLRQSDIEGLTDRHLRRIENGEVRATSGAIESLAVAHRMTPSEYMAAVAERLDDNDDDE